MAANKFPTIVVETTFEELVAFMRTLPSDQPENKGKMSIETKTYVTPEELRALGFMHLERGRQVDEEKYTNEDDDAHQDGSLWQAAYFYATVAIKPPIWPFMFFKKWPWGPEFFKPWKKDASGNYTTEIDKQRCLVKAGALILAEQERLERALQKVVAKLAEIQNPKDNVP